MPLFAVISGYLFFYSVTRYKLDDLIKRKTQSLLQPIVICGILYYYSVIVLKKAIRGDFSGILSGSWLSTLNGYWFLWSMLCSSLAVALAVKLAKTKTMRLVFLSLGFVFVSIFPNWTQNVFLYPYFIIGFGYAKYERSKIKKHVKRFFVLSIPIHIVMLIFYKREYSIYISGLSNLDYNCYRWLIGLVGSISIIFICNWIYNKAKGQKIKCFFIDLGIHSLQVYIIQRILLENYYAWIYKAIINRLSLNQAKNSIVFFDVLYIALVSISISFLILWIAKSIEKTKINSVLFWK